MATNIVHITKKCALNGGWDDPRMFNPARPGFHNANDCAGAILDVLQQSVDTC